MGNVICCICGNNEYLALLGEFGEDFYCPDCSIIPNYTDTYDAVILKDADGNMKLYW